SWCRIVRVDAGLAARSARERWSLGKILVWRRGKDDFVSAVSLHRSTGAGAIARDLRTLLRLLRAVIRVAAALKRGHPEPRRRRGTSQWHRRFTCVPSLCIIRRASLTR